MLHTKRVRGTEGNEVDRLQSIGGTQITLATWSRISLWFLADALLRDLRARLGVVVDAAFLATRNGREFSLIIERETAAKKTRIEIKDFNSYSITFCRGQYPGYIIGFLSVHHQIRHKHTGC